MASRAASSRGGAHKPLSELTIYGLPWTTHTQLPHTMQKLALGGPHDHATWKKVISRAEVIAHSFTPKDTALMINAFAKARKVVPKNEMGRFLRRFIKEYAMQTIESASAMDLAQMAHGFSACEVATTDLFMCLSSRIQQLGSPLDAQQISLVANAFSREKHVDSALVKHLLYQAEREEVLSTLQGQSLALLLNALSQLSEDRCDIPTALIRKASEVDMDITSLALVLNSFARLRQGDKDTLDLLCEQVVEKLPTASPRQVGMIFNAAGKLGLFHPHLIDQLIVHVHQLRNRFDPLSLCLICNAAAKLRLPAEIFQNLYESVPKHIGSMSAAQLAMLAHAWASAHVYNDDLYELLKGKLEEEMGSLDAHSLALIAYGFAHFKKDLPHGHCERLHALLHTDIKDRDMLMIANAYGRLGIVDANLQEALRKLSDRDNLSPKTKLLYFT